MKRKTAVSIVISVLIICIVSFLIYCNRERFYGYLETDSDLFILPIIALTLCGIIFVLLKTENTEIVGNFPNVITGIVLILVSLIFRYGAEIENKNL